MFEAVAESVFFRKVGWIQTAVRIAESLQKALANSAFSSTALVISRDQEQRFDQCLELLLTVRVAPARFQLMLLLLHIRGE